MQRIVSTVKAFSASSTISILRKLPTHVVRRIRTAPEGIYRRDRASCEVVGREFLPKKNARRGSAVGTFLAAVEGNGDFSEKAQNGLDNSYRRKANCRVSSTDLQHF